MSEDGWREAARVLLVDPAGRVLLLRGFDPMDPDAGDWWFTPGGGLEDGEAADSAARREVREETGAVLDGLEGPVWERRTEFVFEGERIRQHEVYFVARSAQFEVSPEARTEQEVRSLLEARWWSLDELRATTETVHPEHLADLLRTALS